MKIAAFFLVLELKLKSYVSKNAEKLSKPLQMLHNAYFFCFIIEFYCEDMVKPLQNPY